MKVDIHNDKGQGISEVCVSSSDTLWLKREGLESSEPQANPKTYVCLKGTRIAGARLLLCKWHPTFLLQANSDPSTMSSNCAH